MTVCRQNEAIFARAADHQVTAWTVQKNVMPCPSGKRVIPGAAAQNIVLRGAAQHLCGGGAGLCLADLAGIDRQPGDSRLALTCREHMDGVADLRRGQRGHIGQCRGHGVGHAVQMQQPPARQKQEQADPVVAASRDHEMTVSHGYGFQCGHAVKSRVQVVDHMIHRPQDAVRIKLQHAEGRAERAGGDDVV